MNEETAWPTYLRTIAGKDNQKQIAARAEVAPTTVGRWFTDGIVPRAEQVIAVARSYGASPVRALIAAGYLTESDLEGEAAIPALLQLHEFDELEIATELVRRIDKKNSALLDAPLDEAHAAMQQLGYPEGTKIEDVARPAGKKLKVVSIQIEDAE